MLTGLLSASQQEKEACYISFESSVQVLYASIISSIYFLPQWNDLSNFGNRLFYS